MLKSKILPAVIGSMIVLSLLTADPASAQEGKQEATAGAAQETVPKEEKYILTLKTMIEDMRNLRKQIAVKEKELKRVRLQVDKAALSDEIDKIANRLHMLEQDFDQIATGIDLTLFDGKPQKTFNWQNEVLQLLRPVIQEAKKMTARPRQIEKLRNDIDYYEVRLPILKKATENIQTLIEQTTDKTLKKEFQELKKTWGERQQQTVNQMAAARLKLEELTLGKKSILESFSGFFEIFFKSRGKNLLLAIAAFLGVFFILRLLHRIIYKVSPIHRERPVYIRIFDALYHLGTAIGTTLAFLMVLYICGDWVLLTLAALFILGFLWAAKKNLLQFWKEIKILLNLGSVRENERMVYHGVPWKVVSLNIYSELENPALKSRIRLPLKELMDLNSYPYHPDEPWFPCQDNDWVILSDGTRGKVLSQTHEMVRLGLRGGAFKTYLTQDFLSLSPLNLSGTFRLKVLFGIDYKHQADCTRQIPEQLGAAVTEKLKANGFGEDLISLRVDFKTAAASSLDFNLIADFNGNAAPLYSRLEREIQRFSVEACNEFGWEIPFTQVTFHHAATTN